MLNFVLERLPEDENSCMSPVGLEQLSETLSNGFSEPKNYVFTRIFVSPMYFDIWKKSDDIEKLDFHDQNAVTTINSWVKTVTEDKISSLYNNISDEIRAVIVNIVYFKALWKTPFDDSFMAPFYLKTGSVVEVDTMICDGLFMVSDDFSTVRLPYRNSKAVMIISTDEIRSERQLSFKYVRLTLPKFTCEKEYDLTDSLSINLKAFTPGYDNNLFMVEIKQKTYIKVDEEGTEAAAATGCLVSDCASVFPDYTMKINKPFTYLIKDGERVLFAGKCIDPRIN